MKIETEFNIGDTAWVMEDNKPYSFRIENIRTNTCVVDRGNYTCEVVTSVEYQSYGNINKWWGERELYKTKEELKKSVFGE